MATKWREVQLSGHVTECASLEDIRQLPSYNSIVKTVLRQQIQNLLEQLCVETGEESVIITANLSSGTMSSIGSHAGKGFLDNRDDIPLQFFGYCQSCKGNKSGTDASITPGPKRKSHSSPKQSTKRPKGETKSMTQIKHFVTPESSVQTDPEVVEDDKQQEPQEKVPGLINETTFSDNDSQDPTNTTDEFDYRHTVIKQEVTSNDEDMDYNQSFNDSAVDDSYRKDDDNSFGGQEGDESFRGMDSSVDLGMASAGFDVTSTGTPSTAIPVGPVRFVRKYPPKERVNLSLSEKIAIIDEYEHGPVRSHRKLAEKYNVSKSTVAEMLRNKAVLQNAFMINANTKRKRFNSASRYADINALVWSWFTKARESGIQMSGPMIQEKALQLAKELQVPGFKGSNGWLHSWKSRYNITSFKDETSDPTAKPLVIKDYSKVEGIMPPGGDTETASASSIMNFGTPLFNFVTNPAAMSLENASTGVSEQFPEGSESTDLQTRPTGNGIGLSVSTHEEQTDEMAEKTVSDTTENEKNTEAADNCTEKDVKMELSIKTENMT